MAAYNSERFKWVLESGEWMHHSREMSCHEPEITGRLRSILQDYTVEKNTQ